MKRICASGMALFFAAAAAPSNAGVVYVPVIPLKGSHEIRVTASNNHPSTSWHYVANVLPLNTDGTLDERSNPAMMFVPPLRTTEALLPNLSTSGLIEIAAAPQLGFSATLFPAGTKSSPDNIGVPLPIITSDEARKAGEWILVQGLQRSAQGTRSDVGVVNLGHSATRCTAWVVAADGTPLGGSSAILDLRALTMAYFDDVLGLLGQTAGIDVLLRLNCDQSFYAFGVVRNGASGAIKVRTPAARGSSLLRLPGQGPAPEPEPEPEPPAPEGAFVFSRPGLFHTSLPSNPTYLADMNIGTGRTFSRIRVVFDYRHGSWSNFGSSKEHNLFWLHRGGTGSLWEGWFRHVYGYANIHGPNQNRMRNIYGVDVNTVFASHTNAVIEVGGNYRVEYIYDGTTFTWTYDITDLSNNQLVNRLTGNSFAPVRTGTTGFFFIYMGHSDEHVREHPDSPEVPSYGSQWSNLRVEFIP